ncbi:uncharacterized protein LOC116666108 [Camelus ferus]|uniref:Uncharacterized protein LOC116666108 n=1 Tax=Camelus ferus TaxID=419612 RepID=A0A8B8TPB3_CAMFR|nr:uncharacterized protein LOC116666108 [Camelus ferus]
MPAPGRPPSPGDQARLPSPSDPARPARAPRGPRRARSQLLPTNRCARLAAPPPLGTTRPARRGSRWTLFRQVGAAALYPAGAERARRGRSRTSPPSPPSTPTTSALTPGWSPRGRRLRLRSRPGQVFPQNLPVPYTLAGRRASSSSSVSGGEKGEATKDGRGVLARGLSQKKGYTGVRPWTSSRGRNLRVAQTWSSACPFQVLLSEEDRMKKRDEKSACYEASAGKKIKYQNMIFWNCSSHLAIMKKRPKNYQKCQSTESSAVTLSRIPFYARGTNYTLLYRVLCCLHSKASLTDKISP